MNSENYVSNLTIETTKNILTSIETNDSVEADDNRTECEICRFHEASSYAIGFGNICDKCHEWFASPEKFNLYLIFE